MRITIVQGPFLPVPPLLGGAVEKSWFLLGRLFASRGNNVVHISRGYKGLAPRERIDGVDHVRISGFTAPKHIVFRLALDLLFSLRVLFVLPPADILVTNSFWLPVLVRTRKFGSLFVHVARQPKGQMRLYRHATLQAVSSAVRDELVAQDPEGMSRVVVIPYPLAHGYFLRLPSVRRNIVLYCGRVHSEKGLHLLVSAFLSIDKTVRQAWALRIVGPFASAEGGGGEQYLEKLQQQLIGEQSSVTFVGAVYNEVELIAEYRKSKIFVYPSLAERGETFGLAPLEAMASGCATVVSDLACFRDFLEDGVNGLVFNHRAPDATSALASALCRLMLEPELIERLGLAAVGTAADYTSEAIAERFLRHFRGLSE